MIWFVFLFPEFYYQPELSGDSIMECEVKVGRDRSECNSLLFLFS